MNGYYKDDFATLYLGDCREITEWLAADVLVTDPPYGRSWQSGGGLTNSDGRGCSRPRLGIAGDRDTGARDEALAMWGDRSAVVFGDLLVGQPTGAVQTLIYGKPVDSGVRGAHAGFRRDVEAIYLVGPWPVGVGGRSSILRTNALVAGPRGLAVRYGHSHAKPVDLMAEIISGCPSGVIADPFAGTGSTLVAAKLLGRRAIGVEIEERHCERAAQRLTQEALPFGEAS